MNREKLQKLQRDLNFRAGGAEHLYLYEARALVDAILEDEPESEHKISTRSDHDAGVLFEARCRCGWFACDYPSDDTAQQAGKRHLQDAEMADDPDAEPASFRGQHMECVGCGVQMPITDDSEITFIQPVGAACPTCAEINRASYTVMSHRTSRRVDTQDDSQGWQYRYECACGWSSLSYIVAAAASEALDNHIRVAIPQIVRRDAGEASDD